MSAPLFAAIERCAGQAPGDVDRALLDRFWAELPDALRQPSVSPDDLPSDLAPGLRVYDTQTRLLHLGRLPDVLRTEFAWALYRVLDLGGKISVAPANRLVTNLLAAMDERPELRGVESLMQQPASVWLDAIAKTNARRRGRLESARTRDGRDTLFRRLYVVLWFDCDRGPWWRRDVWWPRLDPRIPQRRHEPTKISIRWFDIEPSWLRDGLKWYARISLETERLTWSTVGRLPEAGRYLSRFLADRGIDEPHLSVDAGELRRIALDFAGWLGERRSQHGPTKGEPLGPSARKHTMGAFEQFYAFMEREKEAAARELGDNRWLKLGAPHSRLYRAGDKPKIDLKVSSANLISDEAMTALFARIDLLGAPLGENGREDPQAMRILALLAKTGRRQSEIRLLDFDPLEPLLPSQRHAGESDGFVAKLRYQQTKVRGGHDTVFVDAEVTDLIEAQQAWALERMAADGQRGARPKYLFLALTQNRRGDLPYTWPVLYDRLEWLVQRLDIRDENGQLVEFTKTHRFRHTRATNLINMGVPLHVVQRHFGHASPTMTMHYAQTLERTHRAEFARYRKITSSGHELDLPAEDLYDLLQLDQRTDRVLPNGACLLPPKQTCTRGNACLTCDKFVTDASYLNEHEQQHTRLVDLLEARDDAHRKRTGRPMSDDNIWKAERLKEQASLARIIDVLKRPEVEDGVGVRGAGTKERTA